MISKIMKKMIAESDGSLRDINHFQKVWAYAAMIGELEGLDERTRTVLETAAIVHDIACPSLRARYGSAGGKFQEIEGAPMAEAFLSEFIDNPDEPGFTKEMADRVVYIVGHHHTPALVDGPDFQILLEADYLVNADEGKKTDENIRMSHDTLFRTETGRELLRSVYRITDADGDGIVSDEAPDGLHLGFSVIDEYHHLKEKITTPKVYSGLDSLPTGTASRDITEGCIVIEGGAFRGLYNQGVLDALMVNGINFRTAVGVSAGALAGMNYISGQIGRSARANLTYRHDSRFVGVQAFLNCGSILDVDFLLKTYESIDPLDVERLMEPERRLVAVATSVIDGRAHYYDRENCSDLLAAVKASASMPYISPMVEVDGTPCLDGGCSCNIPYRWAIEQGFEKIVVIKTRARGYRNEPKQKRLPYKYYKNNIEFARTLAGNEIAYYKQLEEIEALERDGRLFVVAPSEPPEVGRIEKSMEKLGELYWLGYNDMTAALPALREYLEKQ
ncbi:MAG: patatin-like phospholipase family protein [Clostridia bacterium]|nr:patatin-like phospholipase family protein [Clostridia bacterium]